MFQLNVILLLSHFEVSNQFDCAERGRGMKVWWGGNEKGLRRRVTVHLLCLKYFVAVKKEKRKEEEHFFFK